MSKMGKRDHIHAREHIRGRLREVSNDRQIEKPFVQRLGVSPHQWNHGPHQAAPLDDEAVAIHVALCTVFADVADGGASSSGGSGLGGALRLVPPPPTKQL
ncbi:MAG: hypothetical protein GY772_17145 [bacterium]|nr:hypothetical protein [bacterium]